jgi:hypothetical protein
VRPRRGGQNAAPGAATASDPPAAARNQMAATEQIYRPITVATPSMGRFLSRGCRKGPIHFLVPWFLCSTGQPFLRSLIATQKASTKLSVSHDFFLTSHFPSSTAPQAFPRPDRGDVHAVERRSRQGWPLLRPPPGLALMRPSTMAHCFDRGSLSFLSLSPQHSTNC